MATEYLKSVKSRHEHYEYLNEKDYHKLVPEYAHRHHIHSGYLHLKHADRVFSNYWLILISLHNESLNIFTHLIPAITLCILCLLDNSGLGDIYTELATDAFALSCAVGFFLSVWYHMGCCHCPTHWDFYFFWDLVGIFLVVTTCTLYGTFIGYKCDPLFRALYCGVDTVLLIGYFVPIIVIFPNLVSFELKKWSLFTFISFQMVPLFHWFYLQYTEDRVDVLLRFWKTPVIFFGSYFLGFLVWHYRVPECWAPGRFDIFGHSHQIWHILTAIPPFVWWFGMIDLLRYMDERGCSNRGDPSWIFDW